MDLCFTTTYFRADRRLGCAPSGLYSLHLNYQPWAKAIVVFAFLLFTSSSLCCASSLSRFGLSRDFSESSSFSPFAFELDVNPVIHAPYLTTYSASQDGLPTLGLIENGDSSIIDEQSLSNTPATSGSSLDASRLPVSPTPEQLVSLEDENTVNNTSEAPGLSCSFCECTFGRHFDLKYVQSRPTLCTD